MWLILMSIFMLEMYHFARKNIAAIWHYFEHHGVLDNSLLQGSRPYFSKLFACWHVLELGNETNFSRLVSFVTVDNDIVFRDFLINTTYSTTSYSAPNAVIRGKSKLEVFQSSWQESYYAPCRRSHDNQKKFFCTLQDGPDLPPAHR